MTDSASRPAPGPDDPKDAERLADLLRRRAAVYHPARGASVPYYGDDDIDLLRRLLDDATRRAEAAEAEVGRMTARIRELDNENQKFMREVERLRDLLARVSDKLCHYAMDYPQSDALSIINECDKATARGLVQKE